MREVYARDIYHKILENKSKRMNLFLSNMLLILFGFNSGYFSATGSRIAFFTLMFIAFGFVILYLIKQDYIQS